MTARGCVENVLRRRHGPSDAAIRKLSPDARKSSSASSPTIRSDHVWRRTPVSAAALGTREATMLLRALPATRRRNAVIIGRALMAWRSLAARPRPGSSSGPCSVAMSMSARCAEALMKLDHSSASRRSRARKGPLRRCCAPRRAPSAELGAPIKHPAGSPPQQRRAVRDARSR